MGLDGMALRIVMSMYPSLEVNGDLAVGLMVVYIVLAVLISLKSFESTLELDRSSRK